MGASSSVAGATTAISAPSREDGEPAAMDGSGACSRAVSSTAPSTGTG
ncbi:hypothetical protein [Lysobacter gummosus]